ncbi:hypothetical protein [Pseudohoeflea coraliihabitans]|uniref:Acyl carrier protein n=1 Tax=Pseudohoeflea coraliihabitans TaxID=2860393 RepID=A0ABS6WLE6_9HYPH|nr:hypothetical protein [Pseudohoeflea sp. DP4N28-3]MBW3096483.1 hypothetical protein [Pseudohoeflea sp. DP4N28-3]
MTNDEAAAIVQAVIASVLDTDANGIDQDTPLIGGQAQIDSIKLVEVCLALEDRAEQLGFEFDWTSEATLSRSRSMFRSVGALAEVFAKQAGGGK